MSFRLKVGVVLFLCSFFSAGLLSAQKSYALRLKLSHLDTTQRIACYDLQIANNGDQEWFLGNSNIFVFYDHSVANFRPDTSCLLLDDLIYDLNDLDRNSNNVENSGFPLPYEADLGTIRAGFSTNVEGALMDTLGTWVSTVKLCFDLLMEDITSAETCLQADFINDEIESLLPVKDIVQEYDPNVFISDVPRDTAFNLIPDRTLNSCFILEENTADLCNDGIDNDEDGLLDCDDLSACAPEVPNFNINSPGGCDGSPGLIRINGVTGNAMYSIDDGQTFQSDSVFTGLAAGQYEVLIMKNGVMSCAAVSPIVLEQKECLEDDDTLCSDGQDNDEDGLTDCDDPDCHATSPQVSTSDPADCPELADGEISIDIDSSRYQVSIDSGMTFLDQIVFSDLQPGSYYLAVQNITTLCIDYHPDNPFILDVIECPDEMGMCGDGIDNDEDGLVDCADEDCIGDDLCADFSAFYIPNALNPRSSQNNVFGVFVPAASLVLIEELSIYDRWGGLVFARSNIGASDPSHYWDGRVDGEFISNGVYVYRIRLDQNGLKSEMSGTVTVLQ